MLPALRYEKQTGKRGPIKEHTVMYSGRRVGSLSARLQLRSSTGQEVGFLQKKKEDKVETSGASLAWLRASEGASDGSRLDCDSDAPPHREKNVSSRQQQQQQQQLKTESGATRSTRTRVGWRHSVQGLWFELLASAPGIKTRGHEAFLFCGVKTSVNICCGATSDWLACEVKTDRAEAKHVQLEAPQQLSAGSIASTRICFPTRVRILKRCGTAV